MNELNQFSLIFDCLMKERPKLLSAMCRILGSMEDAEDAFQEMCVVLLRKHEAFSGKNSSSLKTWLFRVAINVALAMHRKKTGKTRDRRLEIEFVERYCPVINENPEEVVIAKDLAMVLQKEMLSSYNEVYWKVIERKAEGYMFKEMTNLERVVNRRGMSSMSMGGIKSRAFRARELAREIYNRLNSECEL